MSNTYTVMPSPYLTILNNSGAIVNGGLVWTYLAGTSTPQATYTDVTGNTENTNPIVADSAGRFVAFLPPSTSYKFVFETAATPPAHGTVLKTVDNVLPVPSSGGTSSAAATVNDFRLTLSTGVPVTVNDVTAATTIYMTPYTGTQIALFDGLGVSTTITSSQVSIAIPATTNTNYDVFVYLSNGIPVLELNPWRNSGQAVTNATNATPIVITANAHGLLNGDQVYVNGLFSNTTGNGTFTVANKSTNTFELQGSAGNGAYTSNTGWINARQSTGLLSRATVGTLTKSGDLTRRYLGTFRTTGSSGQSEDSGAKRFLWNNENRVACRIFPSIATATYAYATATGRQLNADAANQAALVVGTGESFVTLTGRVSISNTAADKYALGWAEDQAVQFSANGQIGWWSSVFGIAETSLRMMPSPGYHTYPLVESATSSTTTNVVIGPPIYVLQGTLL